eukprot:2166187-Amphidinium_carterae.1
MLAARHVQGSPVVRQRSKCLHYNWGLCTRSSKVQITLLASCQSQVKILCRDSATESLTGSVMISGQSLTAVRLCSLFGGSMTMHGSGLCVVMSSARRTTQASIRKTQTSLRPRHSITTRISTTTRLALMRHHMTPKQCNHEHVPVVPLAQVLGIDEMAPLEEVKKAYKKLSLIYHPDKTHGKSEDEKDEYAAIFIQIKNAYQTLGDNPTRRQYDKDRDGDLAGKEVNGWKIKDMPTEMLLTAAC